MKKKIFISHASEDKDAFVRPLATALQNDFDVWYDEFQLVVGSSLLEEISKGLAGCDYGVVVLSKAFFSKKWPQQELNGLFSLEEKDKKIILPIWLDVNETDVRQNSPILADRLAVKASDGIDKVISELKRSAASFDRGKVVQGISPGFSKLRNTLEKRAELERSERIVMSDSGVALVRNFAQSTVLKLSEQISNLVQQGLIKGLRIDGPQTNRTNIWCNIRHGRIWLRAEYQNDTCNSASNARIDFALINTELSPWNEILSHETIARVRYAAFVTLNDKMLWKPDDGHLLTDDELINDWLDKFAEAIDNQ